MAPQSEWLVNSDLYRCNNSHFAASVLFLYYYAFDLPPVGSGSKFKKNVATLLQSC
jgi:hypothetical protein